MYEVKIGDRTNPEPNTLRYFEKQFHLTSTSGGRCKVGVIFDADRMNEESQNALLKTLEEPPPETLLILATGNPAALLPTTRSRCQLLPLLTNRCEYSFPGAAELIGALNLLVTKARGDLALAEEQAAAICRVAAGLNSDATGVPPRSGRGGSMRRPRPATPRSSSASRRRRSTPDTVLI